MIWNVVPVFVIEAAIVDIDGHVVGTVFQVDKWITDDSICIVVAVWSNPIVDAITVAVYSRQIIQQAAFDCVIDSITVTICIQIVRRTISIGVFRGGEVSTMITRTVIESVYNTIAISIGTN